MHYYDVENGGVYRNTDDAKKVLCEVYGVEYTDATLDEAVNSITGYDLVQARQLVEEAYQEELKAGTKKDILESDKEHLLYAYATGKEVANKFHWKQISCMDDKNQIKSIDQINEEIFKEVKKHLK